MTGMILMPTSLAAIQEFAWRILNLNKGNMEAARSLYDAATADCDSAIKLDAGKSLRLSHARCCKGSS